MKPPAPIYSEVASLYDRLVGGTAFENWLANFERLERAFTLPLSSCADIACGTGLVLLHLAAKGAEVYGVDISERMLAIAGEKTAGLKVHLLRQDLRNLRLPRRVGLLTCNTDSLNYLLEEDELGGAVAGFYAALEAGGYALFDMNTPHQLRIQEDRSIWRMREGNVRLYWRSGYDPQTCVATLQMRHVVESEQGNYIYQEVHRERGYPREKVEALLAQAGFSAIYAWDAAGLGPVREGTRRIQFLARRTGS